MIRNFTSTCLAIMVAGIFIFGCSSGQNKISNAVVEPEINQPDISAQAFQSPHTVLGTGLIYIDPDAETFEIVPSRDASIHVNLRRFIEDGVPCFDCFQISGIFVQPDGSWILDLQIRHPWPGLDDFTGFDMRLVMMWNGTEVWPASGLRTQDPDGPDGYVFNADGYTTIFNPTDFPPGGNIPLFSYSVGKFATPVWPDSTLNPYMDYYSNEDRHMMGAGQADTRSWHLRFPEGPFVLGYAIDCSWEAPDVSPPVNLPDDFPIVANKPEAYLVTVAQTEMLGDQVGDVVQIMVTSWDWQLSIGNTWIECPELWEGKVYNNVVMHAPPIVGYYVKVKNENGAPEGEYRALIGVEEAPLAPPPWDFTTYQFFNIEVESSFDPCCETPPVALFDIPGHVITGEEIELESQSYDPDGSDCEVSVAWDLDGDGLYNDSTDEITSISFDEIGPHLIGLMATDSCDLSGTLDLMVTVHVGVTMPEDQDYKTPNTMYGMLSADLFASSTAPNVDMTNPDGPWDFTAIPLLDTGNYRAVLAPDHPEVQDFAGDFTASYLHFYKTSGFFNMVSGSVYMAENYDIDPDRIKWVGLHEDESFGTFTFFPPMYIKFPFWIFSEDTYSISYPPLLEFSYEMEGWGEGLVTVPMAEIEDEPCVVIRYEIVVENPDVDGGVMVYEWLIDDGTMVALVAAINYEGEVNYDGDTGIITGIATYNALNNIGPY